jgi:hypothetical protein
MEIGRHQGLPFVENDLNDSKFQAWLMQATPGHQICSAI